MPELTDEMLHDQLRDWADDLARQIPAWSPITATEDLGEGPPADHPRRRVLAVVGAVAIIAAAVGVWRYSQPGDDLSVASSGGTVVTRYERVEYTQHATLNCPDGQLPDVGFDHSTLEAWADVDGNRWRNTVTYPDGSTRDLIAIGGSPWYPDELYSRGDRHGHPLGCNNLTIGVVVDEPSAHSFFSAEPPRPGPTDPIDGTLHAPRAPRPYRHNRPCPAIENSALSSTGTTPTAKGEQRTCGDKR